MELTVQFLSFFVIRTDSGEGSASKSFRHFQTLSREEYHDSDIKAFLDGEFERIAKRKAERNPNTEQAPTKIGRFVTEEGFEPDSNPNYNLFRRLRESSDRTSFHAAADELVRAYMDTSAVRGGALIIARAKLNTHSDDPIVFVLKCDFEPNIARIADEKHLVAQVDMAISAKAIKSIQYPYMPEEGMFEELELKIHQASHARYFEDFLKYVSYEKSVPELMIDRVSHLVQAYIEQKWPEEASEEREKEEESLEIWQTSAKRELQHKWEHEEVLEATRQLVEQKEDLQMAFRVDAIAVKGFLADYGERIHIARLNGRYVVLIEGERLQFDKGLSPVELLHPAEFQEVMEHLSAKTGLRERRRSPHADRSSEAGEASTEDSGMGDGADTPPW